MGTDIHFLMKTYPGTLRFEVLTGNYDGCWYVTKLKFGEKTCP